MDLETQRALTQLVREFYDATADVFDATRDHAWPGWRQIAEFVRARFAPSRSLRVLDVGCGNGRFATFLRGEFPDRVGYVGVDACERLLARARAAVPDAHLERRDCVLGVLSSELAGCDGFDLVAAFGLLHHVPGSERRARKIAELAALVAPGGALALAFFRFGERERFAARRLDWSRAPAIDVAQLEAGDALLGFGEGDAVRYCHAWSDDEIANAIAPLAGLGFELGLDFQADGRSGDLNRYVVLARAKASAT